MSRRLLARVQRWVGMDKHIAAILSYRIWAVFAGAVTLLIVALGLSPMEQGYYFTFTSLLAAQVFFELGLTPVVIQIVSHAGSYLTVRPNGALVGDPTQVDRITRLVAVLRRWFLAAAVLFFLGVSAGGAVLLGSSAALPPHEWLWPWIVVAATTAVNLRLSPMLAVAQGLGHVSKVAILRLLSSIVGYVGLWVALLAGLGLWSVIIVPSVLAVCSIVWLWRRDPLRSALKGADRYAISWRHDVFPLQWRVALSWASGYFIFSLFTPVVFARDGPDAAGQLGLALSVFSAVTTVGISWVDAKAPELGMRIARNESAELNRLWRGLAIRSTAAAATMGVCIVFGVQIALMLGIPLAQRISPPVDLIALAVFAAVNTLINAFAIYIRAHLEEPLVLQSIITALATAAIVLLIHDVTLMLAVNTLAFLLLALPWVFLVWRRYYRQHTKASGPAGSYG